MTIPRSRPSPAANRRPPAGALAVGAAGAGALAANRDPDLLLDVSHDPAAPVEEGPGHLVPATQVIDGEQALGPGELVRGRRLLVHRPVALVGEDPLALGGAEEVDERPGLGLVLAPGHHRDRVLDQDGLVGDQVVDRLPSLLRGDGLVLVGDHRVALAADEGLQRLAGGLVLHRHVLEELQQVRPGLGLASALLDLRAVGAHYVPAGAARGEGVGVITSTPGFTRSAQVWKFLGLALRPA